MSQTSNAPNSRARNKMSAVEAEIASSANEIGVAFDAQGNEFFRKEGGPRSISFTPEEAVSCKNAFLTHSHPVDLSFSESDVRLAVRLDVRQLRIAAKTSTGRPVTYTFTRPKSGWGMTADEAAAAYREWRAKLAVEVALRYLGGQITRAHADVLLPHLTMMRLAAKMKAAYRRRARE